MIFLDLEMLVPAADRWISKIKFAGNPGKRDHILLGGVFARSGYWFPPKTYRHFWIWDQQAFRPETETMLVAEKLLLEQIYGYCRREYEKQAERAKKPFLRRLTYVGTGIARFDLPSLLIRSHMHKIANLPDLVETYPIAIASDLCTIGSGLFHLKGEPFGSVSTADLAKNMGFNCDKEPGTIVWDLFDKARYKEIEARTRAEVELNVCLYYRMQNERGKTHKAVEIKTESSESS